jgi:hypothetical protein
VSGKQIKTPRVWKLLTDAGLIEIDLDEFPERIKEVKHMALGRLGEMLELKTGMAERQCVAHSLGTLKWLERSLGAPPPGPRSGAVEPSEK